MNEAVKKHWTSLLGALFIVSAFVYLFKYSVDAGWLTDDLKIGIGLLVGVGVTIPGFKLALGRGRIAGEIVTGMGAAIVYATFSFAGIYFALWDAFTVFLCMLAVTALLTAAAFRFGLRLLMNIVLLGALVSPLVMRSESDQVFTLFLYLLVLNAAFFFLSVRKNWNELRPIAFFGSWLLYIVYYIHFQPVADHFWSLPFRYATAAFIFYLIGFVWSSWKNNLRFDGMNLYLGFVNAVIYGLWAVGLLDGIVPFAYPLSVMGLLYIILGYTVYRLTGEWNRTPVMTKLIGGVLLVLLSVSQFGNGMDIKPLLSVYFWSLVAAALIAVGQKRNNNALKMVSIAVWLCVGLYWFVVTWDTPRGEWFGVFIPFLNWGALAWEVLAVLGFYYSMKVRTARDETNNRILANLYAILSHLVVGGLLTVQIMNLFNEYRLGGQLNLTLSVSWGVYALLLFLWGSYSNQNVFRAFGSVVLVIVAIKTLLVDLAGEDTIYKVIVLFVLGIISLAITYINSKWMSKSPPKPKRVLTWPDADGGSPDGEGAAQGSPAQAAGESAGATDAGVTAEVGRADGATEAGTSPAKPAGPSPASGVLQAGPADIPKAPGQ